MNKNVEVKLSLYENTFREIIRLKNLQCKIVAWVVGIFVGMSFIINSIPWNLSDLDFLIKYAILFSYIWLVVVVYHRAIWHIEYVSSIIILNLDLIHNLEKHLGLQNEKWFPKQFKMKQLRKFENHLNSWVIIICLTALYSIFLLIGKLSPWN
jgi:hypothetical protein